MNRAYFGVSGATAQPVDISLVIHRAGVCVLTATTQIPLELCGARIRDLLDPENWRFEYLKVADPILRCGGFKPSRFEAGLAVDGDAEDGARWWIWRTPLHDGDTSVSMRNLFLLHLDALQSLARHESPTGWRSFTTVFLGPPTCSCRGVDAKVVHGDVFAQMMVRHHSRPVSSQAREAILKNYVITADEDLWLSPHCAIYARWYPSANGAQPPDLETMTAIESAILQTRQLEAIGYRTLDVEIHDHDLFSAQKHLAVGLQEFGRNVVLHDRAPRIVDGLFEKFNTAELYVRLNDRVQVLESIVNTRFTRKQSRRSLAVSLIGLLIVLLLLLPRIAEFLDTLAGLNDYASRAIDRLDGVSGGRAHTALIVYVASIAVTVLTYAVLTVPFRFPGPKRRRRPTESRAQPLAFDVRAQGELGTSTADAHPTNPVLRSTPNPHP